MNSWSKDAIGDTVVTDAADTDGNPCADRWANMKNDMHSRHVGSI